MTSPEDIFLFVPNLIGYGRVLFTLGGFLLMIVAPEQWLTAILMYIASFVGDLFDGIVARKLNQTSDFGGLLDMVTDRCSTLGLLFVLSGDYTNADSEIGFPIYRLVRLQIHEHRNYSCIARIRFPFVLTSSVLHFSSDISCVGSFGY
jgi:phosphatidylglycerophosphate synthase